MRGVIIMGYSALEPVKIQHEEIEVLSGTFRKDSKIGNAIRAVARELLDHYDKVDESAIPLFGLFQPLVKEKFEK